MQSLPETALNLIPSEDIIRLCLVSRTIRNICPTYLQNRARMELGNPILILNRTNPVKDYIRVLSQGSEFVTYGSENFIGLDQAVFRVIKNSKSRNLLNYFLSRLPGRECTSKYIRPILMSAVIFRYESIVGELLEKCDFDLSFLNVLDKLARDFKTRRIFRGFPAENIIPPLTFAIREGFLPLVKYLIEQEVWSLDEEFWMLMDENTSVDEYLIEMRAENVDDALSDASFEGHLEIVRYLIDQGAEDLNSALVNASIGGHLNIVKYLIELGATNLEQARLDALRYGHSDVAKYLMEKQRE